VVKSFKSPKKEKKIQKSGEGSQLPESFSVSSDDRMSVEVSREVVMLRNLITNTVIAKFEGHSKPVIMARFADLPVQERGSKTQ
jgi:hypothetical protein